MEFTLKNGVNSIVATLVNGFSFDTRKLVLTVRQVGKPVFNQLVLTDRTESSATFEFYGSSTYPPAIYDYYHGVMTYVKEVYMWVDGVKVLLYSRSV